MRQRQHRFLGAACLTGAAAIWGGLYVVSKVVLEFVPPFTLLAIRLTIGGAALLLVMAWSGAPRVRRADLPQLAVLGLVGFGLSLSAQFAGTRLSSAAHGSVITAITPACILLFAGWLLRERITARKLLAVAVATGGVLLVVELPAGAWGAARAFWGDLLLLLAGISWALYTVLGRLAAERYPPLTVTATAMLCGILFVLPAVPLELALLPWRPMGWLGWSGVLYIGLISTAGAFYLWNKGFTLLEAGPASLFFFVQPVVGALLGWLLLDEPLGGRFLAGTAAILLGGALALSRSD